MVNNYAPSERPYVPNAPGLVTQNIKQQVTVNANSVGTVSVAIPQSATVFLRGYGYTWYSGCTFELRAGFFPYPSRTDQEGSIAQPMFFDTPIKLDSSNSATLIIRNGTSSNLTFDVLFVVYTDRVIPINSTGGEILVPTEGGSGSLTFTHTTAAVATTTTAVLAANGNRKGALIINDSDTVVYIKFGGAAVLNEGIRLNAAGGSFEFTAAYGDLSTAVVNGIHGGTGTKTLLVTEYT